jgi:prohibitin 2
MIDENLFDREKQIIKIFIFSFVGVTIFLTLLTGINLVGAGERGVITEFGKPAYTVGEGISFKIPIAQGITIMNVRTLKYMINASAASKDLQDVSSDIAINYHLIPDKVLETYRDIGTPETVQDTVIAPAVQESVKASTAQYNAEELINQRENVRNRISELLIKKLSDRGIFIEAVSIQDFQFSESYTVAIEQKQVAQQNAQKAVNILQQVQVEAEQKIAQAQGEANATLTKAQAEATALSIQGQALKQNQEVVTLRTIEKWDGHLPNFLVGSSSQASPVNIMMLLNQS